MTRLIFTDEAKQDLLGIHKDTKEKWGVYKPKPTLVSYKIRLKGYKSNRSWVVIGVQI